MKTPLFLIDTSVWLHALGPKPVTALRDHVASLVLENQAAVTTPVVFELLRGARTPKESEALKTHLQSLIYLPLMEVDWTQAAAWGNQLARRGLSASSMDILIAYKAQDAGLVLLHADRDFDRMAQRSSLKVESWVERVRI